MRARGVNATDISSEAWGLSTTTAPDMALLTRSLYYGERLNSDLRGIAFALLSGVIEEQRWGVPAGLPDAAVAFKGGWLPRDDGWVVHQTGLISDDGRVIIFAFFNKGQPTFQYGQETLRGAAQLLGQADLTR